MKTDIFIRTYKNDLEWLKYCLRSIHKYCTGFNDIIICIPENQKHLLEPFNLTKEKVVTCPVYQDDYLGQQISKLLSFKHSEADFIMFVDSDCTFIKNVTPETYIQDWKPVILKTPYEEVGNAICWKDVTEKALGFKVKFEYMRRMPLVYNRSTLKGLYFKFKSEGKDIEDYIIKQSHRNFSEFNVLGAYAEHFEPSEYIFIDTTKHPLPESMCNQLWSWSGLTDTERIILEENLSK